MACLSSTVMFAANPPLHYQINQIGCDADYTKITGVLTIDGVEVYNGEGMQEAGGGNLEIGVFDQNGVCRGAKFPTWRSKSNQWIYQLQIRGTAGFVYHFKVYDHATETELDLVDDFGEEITYQGNYTYPWNGSTSGLNNLYHLNFTYPITKDIIGVDESNWANQNGGYYLIASPLANNTNPADVENMINSAYDLYYFDQAQDLEWINYQDQNDGGYDLVSGKGYLYASKEDTQLIFKGSPVAGNEITVALDYIDGAAWAGWNLVGNPFTVAAYITDMEDNARYFYVLNDDRNEVVSAQGTTIAPMEGAFVCAAGQGESVKIGYTPSGKGTRANFALNLSQNRGVIDRAVVNFGKGNLPKFQLNPSHTKVYIPMEGKDYAVVSAEAVGEMPVNFKAEKSGTYTLSLSTEEVSFTYLHLIDNQTGNDVNLLETPSYSFNAQVTDYAQRFRLVFATGSSVDGDSFGFINAGGNFCIYGIEGEATVQVMDVVGHVLSSDTFSGSYERKLDVASGVYMIRLINGNDVKVQKIVVR